MYTQSILYVYKFLLHLLFTFLVLIDPIIYKIPNLRKNTIISLADDSYGPTILGLNTK